MRAHTAVIIGAALLTGGAGGQSQSPPLPDGTSHPAGPGIVNGHFDRAQYLPETKASADDHSTRVIVQRGENQPEVKTGDLNTASLGAQTGFAIADHEFNAYGDGPRAFEAAQDAVTILSWCSEDANRAFSDPVAALTRKPLPARVTFIGSHAAWVVHGRCMAKS